MPDFLYDNTSGIITWDGSPVAQPGGADVPGRTIVVAKSGGDATTIEAGLTAVSALVPPPTVTDPASVLVYPGIYVEAPLSLQPFVSLVSVGGSRVTFIETNVATTSAIKLAGDCAFSGFTVRGANGVGGIGVLCRPGTGGPAKMDNINVQDCELGYEIGAPGTFMIAHHCSATLLPTETMQDGWLIAGATLRGHSIGAASAGGVPLNSGVSISGIDADVTIDDLSISLCNSGLQVLDDAVVRIIGGTISGCLFNGIYVTPTDGTLHASSLSIIDSAATAMDLRIEGSSSNVVYEGGLIRMDKMFAHPSASVIMSHVSTVPGDEALHVGGELHVGSEMRGAESCLGGGDSHVRGMMVVRNTNLEAGVWADITDIMSSHSGSTAQLFTNVTNGNCCYVGGSQIFPGVKVNSIIAAALGAGTIVTEYWTGATWDSLAVMAADSSFPWDQYGNDVLTRASFEQIRFGDTTGWVEKVLDVESRYWMRFRLIGDIATIPTAEQIKLHTDRTEINADGFIEYFGAARPMRNLTWHRNLLDDISGNSPANATLDISSVGGSEIVLVAKDASFNNGTVDSRGLVLHIPNGLDTSLPVVLHFDWLCTSAAGDVEFNSEHCIFGPGSVLDGSIPAIAFGQTITVPGVAYEVAEFDVPYLIPDVAPHQFLAIRFYRDATVGNDPPDTSTGNVHVIATTLTGTFWK
jgi:hypothetical protein